MATMPWFRTYSEILDDKKIKRICRSGDFCKATVIGAWICLLALASESEDRGKLLISENIPYDLEDIFNETELPYDEIKKLMELFLEYDMLLFENDTYIIKNWDGRQFKSDNSTDRVRKHREMKRDEENSAKRYSNVIDTDTDTESESDKETELINIFCDATGLPLPNNLTNQAKWIQETGEWIKLGAGEKEIRQAVDTALEKEYTVVRPSSITNFIRSGITKKNAKRGKSRETLEEMEARLLHPDSLEAK